MLVDTDAAWRLRTATAAYVFGMANMLVTIDRNNRCIVLSSLTWKIKDLLGMGKEDLVLNHCQDRTVPQLMKWMDAVKLLLVQLAEDKVNREEPLC